MISGAGMLDFLACHSTEKLVIDAEAIASAQRLLEGIEPHGDSLAIAMFAQTGLHGDFLKLAETRAFFRKEQHFPSSVIDRGLTSTDATSGILDRACRRVEDLLAAYERPSLSAAREKEIEDFANREALNAGFEGISEILHLETVSLKR
jgi:trimethylamine:corrinoid methyltransferase-like protein